MKVEKSSNESSPFAKFHELAQKAEAKLSLLGSRYIYISNSEEVLNFDDFVMDMGELLYENRHFDESERPYIKEISIKINQLYKISDEQVENSNFFTWLINRIREIFCKIIRWKPNHASIRWVWSDCKIEHIIPECDMYKYYTPIQFEKNFGYIPTKENNALDFYIEGRTSWFRLRKEPARPRSVWHPEIGEPKWWHSTIRKKIVKNI